MEDQKQIEEMATAEMIQKYLDNNNIKVSNRLLPLHIADMLFVNNYRKLHEDSVVLTREELHEIEENAYQVGVTLGKSFGRKEMAKEILLWFEERYPKLSVREYFIKQYGVEVE